MRGLLPTVSGAAIFALSLFGCADRPFVTKVVPSEASPDGLKVVSVCYDARVTTREAIGAVAVKECKEEGADVRFWRHDTMFNDCPVLAKTRVSFLCVAPAK